MFSNFSFITLIFLILVVLSIKGQPPICDHTPPKAKVLEPSTLENQLRLSIVTKQEGNKYSPDQTYVVTLQSLNPARPFKWFMITAEDPDIDNEKNTEDLTHVDVGTLKPFGEQSRYSERCYKTLEEADELDKFKVEVHWISPKQSSRGSVRLRAMVAENEEVWYTGDNLTLIIDKLDRKPSDRPPLDAREKCSMCSEALYEVIFAGQWSRLTHPLHYPKEPDMNGFSEMIGASHDYDFRLWEADSLASPGLKDMAQTGNISIIQRDIIDNISLSKGVRTLIKGRGHMHPQMSVPSYALFRVDRFHHLFSLIVSLIPSPDWFLGTSMFELCDDNKWLETYEIPLYPWDAGTANGISYESEISETQPVATIQRVQVGSFDEASPFYQMNLNDLKPFALLQVNKVDEFAITDGTCETDTSSMQDIRIGSNYGDDQAEDEPNMEELKSHMDICEQRQWGEWTPCIPSNGDCGAGTKTRSRIQMGHQPFRYFTDSNMEIAENNCNTENSIETQRCKVIC